MAFGEPFAVALAGGVRSALCTVLNTVDLMADSTPFRRLPLGGAADAARGVINGALCNSGPPPSVPPGFTGGQCDCQRYNVTIGANNGPGGPFIIISTLSVWGPVNGVSYQESEDGTSGIITLRCRGATSEPCGNANTVEVTTGPLLENVSITNITSPDGPDDCGDAPPSPTRPNGGNTNVDVDINFTNNIGVNVTTPVNIAFAIPIVNVRGEVNFPFRLTLAPNVSFGGTVNQNGDVNISIGDPRAPDSPGDRNPNRPPCGDPGEPEEEPPPPPPGVEPPPEEPEEPEEEPIYIGAAVTSTIVDSNRATVIFQGDNPDIYAPALGYISFFCRVGRNSGFWTEDIPIKNLRQIIACPWPAGAIRIAGTPISGVIQEITPITGTETEGVNFYE